MSKNTGLTSEPNRISTFHTFKELIPGTKIDLQFLDASKLRVKAKLIGYEMDRYIVLKIPYAYLRDYSKIIQEKNDCIVRTIVENDQGLCVAFRSTVVAIIPRIKGLIFISFPNKVESIALRKEERVPAHLPVTLTYIDDSSDEDNITIDQPIDKMKGHIVDLSPGGCRASITWERELSDIRRSKVLIQIRIKQQTPIELKATIRNQTQESEHKVILGMAFDSAENLDELLTAIKF